MVADGIQQIQFHTSPHSEYLQNFQEYLECMEENMCILNETTQAWVKKLQVTIEDFEGTTAYIKGQVARNMWRIKTLDQKIHNTFEDRYISTIEKSITELSKASVSSSTSPFQEFSEQVQCELDSLRYDIANLSKSNFEKVNSSSRDISSLQKTVASTDSKLDLILAKLSGSNEWPHESEGEKVNKTKSSQSRDIHHIPDSPNEFEKKRHEKIESLDKMAVDA
ncbi:unnamed protein product [Lactuca saligna]|uniref:Uncharacterized protein n=1 Tax=Lactuca saligna TaxID=75948 RepID=A0AA36DX11_LACSI|nr:unnamed protein product [Lactuca saligna]